MKFHISNVARFQIAITLYNCMFWVPIITLFYNFHGFSTAQAFEIIAFQQLIIVILEYPTGIIGDAFSHKLSVSLGFLAYFISMILLGTMLSIDTNLMYFLLTISALGITLVSGSDTALLHTISKDFTKEMAKLKSYGSWFSALSLIVGGLLGSINLKYPFLATALACFIAFLLTISIKVEEKGTEEKIGVVAIALLGLKESIFNMKIFFPIFISSVVGMYISAEKWILPTVFANSSIPVALFGLATAAVTIFRGQSGGVYKRYGDRPYWLLILLMIIATAFVSIPQLSVIALMAVYMSAGYIIMQSDIAINGNVDSRARASVMSFRNLFVRLLNSPYLWIVSLATTKLDFSGVNIVMSLVFLFFVVLLFAVYSLRKRKVSFI